MIIIIIILILYLYIIYYFDFVAASGDDCRRIVRVWVYALRVWQPAHPSIVKGQQLFTVVSGVSTTRVIRTRPILHHPLSLPLEHSKSSSRQKTTTWVSKISTTGSRRLTKQVNTKRYPFVPSTQIVPLSDSYLLYSRPRK